MSEKKMFVERNSLLIKEFDRYILEHPEFAKKIPDKALVVLQVKGDEEFNRWARESSKKMADENGPVVWVTIGELKPVRSRIEKIDLELAA
ncbi:MAG: hypothetical protein HY787_09860 [Deltaproteobacteria bacterium]|nr:hypothetical protein [Deltaproteobacteria bacterium]